jgi:predicted 3-demethylubiquinone-9 3-methyltransferase (glyoxalase superfamily)
MQKITPHLWFDKEAKEAAEFYVSVFGGNSHSGKITTLHETPSGDTPIAPFTLLGHEFMSMSAGPLFKFNPSVSFIVAFKSKEEVDAIWKKLSAGGQALMELGEYPFNKRYGWTADKYGLSWQVLLDDGHYQYRQPITPTLLFVGEVCGKAEEAMNFYASIFPKGNVGEIARHGARMAPEKEGTVMHGSFFLAGQEFFAMDSAHEHKFKFNEAISFMVYCDDQAEIDRYWEKLSAVPEAEQCGWLKDKFGLSWQIVSTAMGEMLQKGTPEQIDRVTQAFLPMKKIIIADLEKAYEG